MTQEQTLALFKPDTIERNLVGTLVDIILKNKFRIVAMKMLKPPKTVIRQHYIDLSDRPFFPAIRAYMSNQTTIALILEKENAIQDWRQLMGATHPKNADESTIRGKYGDKNQNGNTLKNLVHGSDSPENALREIKIWFPELTIVPNTK